MASDCDPMIADSFAFPRKPANRPALRRFGYRIGEYPELREAMIRHIDGQIALEAWTHRGADDPGIALLEGAAVLGDILSFYQERYANEAFLRSATWRESIAALVRLTGYRLAPAIGGTARVAIEVKPGAPVSVPQGFPVKAEIEGGAAPAVFEANEAITAYPQLSRFHLYRRRRYASQLSEGAETAEVASAGGVETLEAKGALGLKAGDKIMLLSRAPDWTTSGSDINRQQRQSQVLKIKEVEVVLGRTTLTFETPFDASRTAPHVAYKLGRSFRHFGHGAPATYTTAKKSGSEIVGANEHDTDYARHLTSDHSCTLASVDRALSARDIPLDQEVSDLMVGGSVIVEADVKYGSTTRHLTQQRKITRLRPGSMGFAAQTGPTTMLRMDSPLIENASIQATTADIREIRVHEVIGPEFTLRARAYGHSASFSSGTNALYFYGRAEDAALLADRQITLVNDEDGRAETLTVVTPASDFTGGGMDPKMWPISFDSPPELFTKGEFLEDTPTVTVFGNLITASEGKTRSPDTLGNGDARVPFQTFKLPKPLTYHLSPGATPAQRPELSVYVDGIAWSYVPSLFGQGPDAQVYIVREDADGVSWVQFGDGKTGARLTSGIGNVTAIMRTGSGARGPLKEGATPGQADRIPAISKLAMPEPAWGGADREEAGNAQIAAPGLVQGLGRLVSLADYETELLTIPGVLRTRADWEQIDGVPGLVLRVLLEAGREDEFEQIRAIIQSWQKCRGPNRFALSCIQAFERKCWLDVTYGLDPRYLKADVEAAIRAALAPSDAAGEPPQTGLFALPARRLGAPEYASRIAGTLHQIEGVTYAHVTAFGLFGADESRSGDPLVLPPAPRPRAAKVVPATNEILTLPAMALGLTATAPDTVGDCA